MEVCLRCHSMEQRVRGSKVYQTRSHDRVRWSASLQERKRSNSGPSTSLDILAENSISTNIQVLWTFYFKWIFHLDGYSGSMDIPNPINIPCRCRLGGDLVYIEPTVPIGIQAGSIFCLAWITGYPAPEYFKVTDKAAN